MFELASDGFTRLNGAEGKLNPKGPPVPPFGTVRTSVAEITGGGVDASERLAVDGRVPVPISNRSPVGVFPARAGVLNRALSVFGPAMPST